MLSATTSPLFHSQVTINGEAVLNATLERVEELLAADLPVRLEVAQPVLEEPLYIREAQPAKPHFDNALLGRSPFSMFGCSWQEQLLGFMLNPSPRIIAECDEHGVV